MMTVEAHEPACERARTRAALAPDGDLSPFELRLLGEHLRRCPPCARFAADIETITTTIRSAPLEPPPARLVVSTPRRGSVFSRVPRSYALSQLAAVAAGAAVAITMGSSFSDKPGRTVSTPLIVIDEASVADVGGEPAELRAFRRAAVMAETHAAPRLWKHPGTQPL